jgi:hypothetical protein
MHAIHNARIQLFVTALNNLGAAAIVAGLVGPGGQWHGYRAWFAFGAGSLTAAQLVLGTTASFETYWLVVPLVGAGAGMDRLPRPVADAPARQGPQGGGGGMTGRSAFETWSAPAAQ